MRWLVSVAAALVAFGLLAAPLASAEEEPVSEAATSFRVGTFNTRAVALAYGRSEAFEEYVDKLMAEAKEAEAAGDQERVDELSAKGAGLQEEMHEKVFFGAPIPDILEKIEGLYPAIAEEAGVDVIASDILYAGSGVDLVDITDFMVKPFSPDEETLGIIEEVKQAPIPEREEE